MNRLNERISKAEVLFFVKELHHNEEGIAQFCNVLLNSEQERGHIMLPGYYHIFPKRIRKYT